MLDIRSPDPIDDATCLGPREKWRLVVVDDGFFTLTRMSNTEG